MCYNILSIKRGAYERVKNRENKRNLLELEGLGGLITA